MKYVLPCVLACASASIHINAVAEELPTEHVLVSVPLHKKAAETALPVTVISGDELRRQAAATIGDTLKQQPRLGQCLLWPRCRSAGNSRSTRATGYGFAKWYQ